MSFDEGMRLFRSGNITGARGQFHQAVEQDENNHKAWNALGICLSKTGEYEDADTCFENALMLEPGNSTYERNREKNSLKIPIRRPENKISEPVRSNAKKGDDTGYQRNWFQIPLYFIPIVFANANPIIGLLAVITCAYYIKRDADSLHAGRNPDASLWGKMKGWEWMVLLILLWILLPLYSWKREQIFKENLGYSEYNKSNQNINESGIWRGVKIIGGLLIGFIIFIVIISVILEPNEAGKATGQTIGDKNVDIKHTIIEPTKTSNPIIEHKVNSATLGERNAAMKALDYLKISPFSRDGLIKQLEFEGYSHAEAIYGVDQTDANWNEQAAGKAEKYLELTSFSRDGLIEQLEFEGFTPSQAEYGARAVGY